MFCLANHEGGTLLFYSAVVEHEPCEEDGRCTVVVGAFLCWVTLCDMPSYCILVADSKQIALAKVEGYVDAVARLEREQPYDSCRNGNATITGECYVGAACSFQ